MIQAYLLLGVGAFIFYQLIRGTAGEEETPEEPVQIDTAPYGDDYKMLEEAEYQQKNLVRPLDEHTGHIKISGAKFEVKPKILTERLNKQIPSTVFL